MCQYGWRLFHTVQQSKTCKGRRQSLQCECSFRLQLNKNQVLKRTRSLEWICLHFCKKPPENKTYLSLGSQLVKTVRSLLSLILSQGMSSSSADKDMAFTLSSRLNTLEDKLQKKRQHLNEEFNSAAQVVIIQCEYVLTYRPQGTGPAASSQCGPGQSAAIGSICS